MRFIDAVSDNDFDRIQSFFSDDSVFSNMPGDKVVGQSAIWDVMATIHNDAEQVDWQVNNLSEDESGSVLTEGCLRYLINGKWQEYPIKGAFEVKGSKITQWH